MRMFCKYEDCEDISFIPSGRADCVPSPIKYTIYYISGDRGKLRVKLSNGLKAINRYNGAISVTMFEFAGDMFYATDHITNIDL